LPSPIALAVKATKAEALYDRPSDFKGVDDQADTDQQKSTCHGPADERPIRRYGDPKGHPQRIRPEGW